MMKPIVSFCVMITFALLMVACAGGLSPHNSRAVSSQSNNHYDTVSDAFSMHDTNNDGFLDRHEFVQFQQDPGIIRLSNRVSGLRNAPLLFEEIDENGDDRISRQEMRVAVSPRLSH